MVALHWGGDATYLIMLKVGLTDAMLDVQHKACDCVIHVAHLFGIREVMGSFLGQKRVTMLKFRPTATM